MSDTLTPFAALRALTEALLTGADPDYLHRQIDTAVKVMRMHGVETPVPWPPRASSGIPPLRLEAYAAELRMNRNQEYEDERNRRGK